MRRLTTFATIAAVTIGGLTSPAAAHASGGGMVTGLCEGNQKYYVSPAQLSSFKQASPTSLTAVSGEGGITLVLSRTGTFTVGSEVTGTVSTEAGVIFAKASASVSVSLSSNYSQSTTMEGQWTVPETWTAGRLAFGSATYSGTWKRYYERPSDCRAITLSSGTYRYPRAETHFVKSRLYS